MSLKTNILTGSAFVMIFAGAAQAKPVYQSDISDCRAAISAENPGVLKGYRLRFKSVTGMKARKISFQAIPNNKSVGERFNVTCEMSPKNEVLAVRTDKKVKLVKK